MSGCMRVETNYLCRVQCTTCTTERHAAHTGTLPDGKSRGSQILMGSLRVGCTSAIRGLFSERLDEVSRKVWLALPLDIAVLQT